jgi:hypothetical protein
VCVATRWGNVVVRGRLLRRRTKRELTDQREEAKKRAKRLKVKNKELRTKNNGQRTMDNAHLPSYHAGHETHPNLQRDPIVASGY